ncbi:MAG: MATE family efflux transporter [Deltaproteobacteria bacterium]|nr:MATE family efflux transporter [Deltaproteobacteria bacterium]
MKKMDKNSLDSDHVGRLLIMFAIPAFISMAIHTLYNVVDTIFIGQYVGRDAIGALTLVFPVQILSLFVGMLAGVGGASLISRLLGANNKSRAERALGNSFTITIALSVIITAAGLANVPLWCHLLGASEATMSYASDYLQIIMIGMFFMTFIFVLSSLIRAAGNAKVPMIGMVLSAALNILLDWVFIGLLDGGVKGAAWATVISQIVGVVYFMSYYFIGKPELSFTLKDLKPDWKIFREILVIGFSAGAMVLSGSVSAIIVNRTVIAFGGDLALATWGVLNRAMMFAIMPSIVIGQAIQPIVGFNYGARRFDRVLRSIKISGSAATAIGLLVFLAVYLNPATVIRIFIDDNELIELGTHAARLVFLAMYVIGLINIGATVFQSIGKAVQAFFSTTTRSVLFLIPAILILPRFLGLDGVWWAFPITDFMTFFLVLGMLIPLLLEMRRLNSKKKIQNEETMSSGEVQNTGLEPPKATA